MAMIKASERMLTGSLFDPTTNSGWEQNYYFIQAADTQLGMMHHWGTDGTGTLAGSDGKPYPDSNWEQEITLCKQSVAIMNSLEVKPAFFIVCGDLVDAFADQWPEIRAKQEADLKAVYSELDPSIPMICVCGNHDIGNQPTVESIEKYKTSFGDDFFSFYHKGAAFIVLNSQFYENASMAKQQYKEHEIWLERELQVAKDRGVKHIVVFQHIPWFVSSWDEEKMYFNVEKELRVKKLDQFLGAGVSKVFCGHYHRNAGGKYKDLEVVVTSAIGCQLGTDHHGMRIVKVFKEYISHEFHSLKNFPSKISLQ